MGLRIIDRDAATRAARERPLSEAELLTGLRHEVQSWIAARGGPAAPDEEGPSEAQFMSRCQQARGRLTCAADVAAVADRIGGALRQRNTNGTALHVQVDIATLLELL